MILFMLLVVSFTGAVSQWDHFTHFGGVNAILLRNDVLTAATTGGMAFGHVHQGVLYWDSTWVSPGELSISDARCMAVDRKDNLWIGTKGGGIDVALASGGFRHYGQLEGLPVSLQINCILADSVIWAGTTEGLCIKELGYFENWNTLSTGGGLPSNVVNCVAMVDSGLFVGTTSGLVMLRAGASPKDPASWVTYRELKNSIVQDVLVHGDTVWAATTAGIYMMIGDSTWTMDEEYPYNSPMSLAWGWGKLAAGDRGRVSVLDGGTWIPGSEDLGAQVVEDICWLSEDVLLIAQYNDYAVDRASGNGVGIGYLDSWVSSRHPGAPSNDLRSVTVDTRGDVWVTSNMRGASVLSDGSWHDFLGQLQNVAQVFACSADDSGGVFIAPYHHGITWVNWKGTPGADDDEIIHFDASNSGLLNDQVMEISVSPSGEVWFAHEPYWETPSEPSGVSVLSWVSGEEDTAVWRNFQPSDGLPSGIVKSVEPSGEVYAAWMGTQGGLALGDVRSGEVRRLFTSSSGLPADEILSLAMSRDGKLYVGTAAGLAVFDTVTGSLDEVEQVTGNVTMLCFDNLSTLWSAGGNGLFRIFSDGDIETYNTTNSPLQSLDVKYAACDPGEGYLYLATDHGLWRLHLEQGIGGETKTAVVYPNPFVPGIHRVLGVAGIPDTPFDFSLFDLAGSLVYESHSRNRDDFAWDGMDMNGKPVPSGTYIVRITQDGTLRLVKLALVR